MNIDFFGANKPNFSFAGKYASALSPTPKTGFSPQTPQQWLQYKEGLKKQGYSSEDINAAMQQYAPSATSNTPEGKLVEVLVPLMQKQVEQNIWASSPEGMKYQLELARQDAKEKAKQGLMWNTLAKLPETIANAPSPYGGPVGAAMAYQGVSAIPGIYSTTAASYPQLQIPGTSTQQYRYF